MPMIRSHETRTITARRSRPLQRQQAGFTLIEVMVAFLITAIGLLGLASMQSRGLQVTQNAYFRTQAAFLAMDMAERMRTNRVEAIDLNYVHGPGDGAQDGNCNNTNGCSATALRDNDIFEWQELVAQLPGGEAVVCVDSDANTGDNAGSPDCDGNLIDADTPVLAIKVWWQDQFSDDPTEKQRFVLSVSP